MVLDEKVEKALERAAVRAKARDLDTRLRKLEHAGFDATEFYDVASHSTPGTFHRVRLDYTVDGVNAHCDCLGNQNGRICQHIAAALEASTALTQPEPKPRSAALDLMASAGLLGSFFGRRLA